MKTRTLFLLSIIVLVTTLLVGCSPAARHTTGDQQPVLPAMERQSANIEVVTLPPAPTEAPALLEAAPPATPGIAYPAPKPGPIDAAPGPRMIVKDAVVKLQVADTAVAIDRTTQIASDLGGYIISSRIWYQPSGEKNYQYATLALGVPVDRFEEGLNRLRQLAVRVLDENATGNDVTSEYVDLQSRLTNLVATRDRIRQFLAQATTVDEALKVNDQLANVEGQIEQVQGRMNYLSGRTSFSTITVNIEPEIQEPTPTATPTPSPTPTATPWSPATTFHQASGTLSQIGHIVVEAAIWTGVVLVPLVLPVALLVFIVLFISRRRKKVGGPSAPTPAAPEAEA